MRTQPTSFGGPRRSTASSSFVPTAAAAYVGFPRLMKEAAAIAGHRNSDARQDEAVFVEYRGEC
jgi:hypothetical protein